MRIIISLITASVFAAAGSTAWAETAPAEPAKTEASATPATPATADNFVEAIMPVTQSKAPKPRESGLDQPLCTGE